ncbi:MaoC family dehydratase [Actinomadura sp. SCN-SB]|uniref:MaoC family dehydratase n=1 Tax=Actinomadura sp. SCN-SB TaxID=3373092 RepID=UPI0037510B40
MAITVNGIDELKAKQGEDLGHSAWIEVSQDRVNTFADATGDHQWIHVDVERAKAGPFKGTIAHGYLTLSLLIPMWSELLRIEGIGMAVNYGLNKVRFPAPVPAGSKVRLAATIKEITDVAGGGVQAVVDATIECDATDKPVCVAQVVYRYYP